MRRTRDKFCKALYEKETECGKHDNYNKPDRFGNYLLRHGIHKIIHNPIPPYAVRREFVLFGGG